MYTFLQPSYKKIPCVWILRHTPIVYFYNQWYFSTINTSPTWQYSASEIQKEIYTTGLLLQIHYLCNFCRQCYINKLMVLMCAAGHCTWPVAFCKNFQTPNDHCQNYTLLRITGDDYRIVFTHIYKHTHTHTLCKYYHICTHIYLVVKFRHTWNVSYVILVTDQLNAQILVL